MSFVNCSKNHFVLSSVVYNYTRYYTPNRSELIYERLAGTAEVMISGCFRKDFLEVKPLLLIIG